MTASYYSHLGDACFGCGGKSGKTRGRTKPPKRNAKLAKKYGWNIKPGGKYKSVSDKQLAMDIYCFQNEVENANPKNKTDCSGICEPKTVKGDCYNRDGMIGNRTLQLIGNAIAEGTSWETLWKGSINIPAKYQIKRPPPPASDVRSSVAQGEGKAGAQHILETTGKEPQDLQAGGSPSWLLIAGLGVVAAGALGYHQYQTNAKFRNKINKLLK